MCVSRQCDREREREKRKKEWNRKGSSEKQLIFFNLPLPTQSIPIFLSLLLLSSHHSINKRQNLNFFFHSGLLHFQSTVFNEEIPSRVLRSPVLKIQDRVSNQDRFLQDSLFSSSSQQISVTYSQYESCYLKYHCIFIFMNHMLDYSELFEGNILCLLRLFQA